MKTQSLLKKCFVILMFLGIIGMANLSAQEFTVGDLNYRINDDGVSVTVTGHVDGQSATGELIIPESVNYYGNDYPVTIIGESAFAYCFGLTGTLTIPNTIIVIENNAFNACSGFDGDLIIPDPVGSIGRGAFYRCWRFNGSLIMGYSLTEIGDYAFSGCMHLTGVVTIGNSVTSIGINPFVECYSIEGIVVEDGNNVYDSRNNCNAIIKTSTNELISGCYNTIIPNDVISIGNSAFADTWIESIDIPNSVVSIGDFAFEGCYGLYSIFIPFSVTSIGINPFSRCSIEEMIVDSSNSIYDSRNNCNAIIKTSTNELVSGCKNTIIPDNVVSIGDYAFRGCQIASINIPSSVITIGNWTFSSCSATGSLIIPNSVVSIGDFAFYYCDDFDGELIIGNSVTSIGEWAFADCSNFSEAVILATTPPILVVHSMWGVFQNFGTNSLTVPCGCVPVYENSDWRQYFNTFIEDCSDVAELDENLASVYPNPTSSIVKIEAENIQNISIYNMLGEMVFDSAASGDTFEYDFSNNESGVYIVRIETAKGVVTKCVTVR